MIITELKQLAYAELQALYANYLEQKGLSQNTINTSKSDAFYLYKKRTANDFWAIIESNDFETIARQALQDELSKNSKGDISKNISGYLSHLRRFREFVFADASIGTVSQQQIHKKQTRKSSVIVPTPCIEQMEHYLLKWDTLENYRLQEDALNKLFHEYAPQNTNIYDILLKTATLNDFYSTNIFSTFPVAKHILEINIDDRLIAGDESLVDEIKDITINGKRKSFYSFATKYCSHHNAEDYPIYDSYVDEILIYFRNKDAFAEFSASDLKSYPTFKNILNKFRVFYGLTDYPLKQLDQYLWQLGKEYFPKNYY